MNGLGQQFLAGTAFALDKDTGIPVGNAIGPSQQIFHGRVAGNDSSAPLLIVAGTRHGRVHLGLIQGLTNLIQQFPALERLGQKAENTAFGCLHRIRNGAMRGQDDDGQKG